MNNWSHIITYVTTFSSLARLTLQHFPEQIVQVCNHLTVAMCKDLWLQTSRVQHRNEGQWSRTQSLGKILAPPIIGFMSLDNILNLSQFLEVPLAKLNWQVYSLWWFCGYFAGQRSLHSVWHRSCNISRCYLRVVFHGTRAHIRTRSLKLSRGLPNASQKSY